MSLAGLITRPVLNQHGDEVGHVVNLVAQVHGSRETYPLVTGVVIRVGRRRAYLDSSAIDPMRPVGRRCGTARFGGLAGYRKAVNELARDMVAADDGAWRSPTRSRCDAAAGSLAQVGEQIHLVGVDVSLQTLLRQAGAAPVPLAPHPGPGDRLGLDRVLRG